MSNLSVNRTEPKRDRAMEISSLSPLALGARSVFKAMVWIFAACLLIQVFLAGLALFWNQAQWSSHTGFARVLIIVPILMFVVSFVARLPLSLRLRSAGLIGLVILIAVCANLPSGIGYLSALHPVIAVILLVETMSIARRTRAITKAK